MRNVVTILLTLFCLGKLSAQSGLIPEPVTYRRAVGEFRFGHQLGIAPGAGVSRQLIALVQTQFRTEMGVTLVVTKTKPAIELQIDANQIAQAEGYQLLVQPQKMINTTAMVYSRFPMTKEA